MQQLTIASSCWLPESLAEEIDKIRDAERDGHARYIMNLATYSQPGPQDPNMRESLTSFWVMYRWLKRGGTKWKDIDRPTSG
jgi:hypothetical protein